uniref:RCC1-like domain-containing protein n=1 Tax=Arcella intermedia TaxID=1963864 RepID=A0A6B2L9K2_9EUKA
MFHSIAITSKHQIYIWGYNDYGQLGRPINGETNWIPTQITSFLGKNRIIDIGCGNYFSMALTNDGLLYSWGINGNGELGIGYTGSTTQLGPQRIVGMSKVRKFCCGGYHSLALTEEGELYGWGYNVYGQLGIERQNAIPRPTKINHPFPSKIEQISCGCFHSMVLLSDGSLYTWGQNEYGQGGIANNTSSSKAIPKKVNGIPGRIIQIKCGKFHSMVITDNDDLYCWGNNLKGELGDKTFLSKSKPQKMTYLEGIKKRFIMIDLFYDWPQTHNLLPKKIQQLLEEILIILKAYISKDVTFYFLTIFFQIYQYK